MSRTLYSAIGLAFLIGLTPPVCGTAFSAHDPSIDLKVESLEANPGKGVHLKLTAIPLTEAPSLEISCQAPWALSVDPVSDHGLPTIETSGIKRIRFWKGPLKKDRSKSVDFWIQAPDLGAHEAVLTATITFPDSDWQLANAVSVRLDGERVLVQPLLTSKGSFPNSSFRAHQNSLALEPIREIEVETQDIR